jgi:hypothetical protein
LSVNNSFHFWATHSQLAPIVDAAKTLKNHLLDILTYERHKITNAIGESINSNIEKMKRLACGYRNRISLWWFEVVSGSQAGSFSNTFQQFA